MTYCSLSMIKTMSRFFRADRRGKVVSKKFHSEKPSDAYLVLIAGTIQHYTHATPQTQQSGKEKPLRLRLDCQLHSPIARRQWSQGAGRLGRWSRAVLDAEPPCSIQCKIVHRYTKVSMREDLHGFTLLLQGNQCRLNVMCSVYSYKAGAPLKQLQTSQPAACEYATGQDRLTLVEVGEHCVAPTGARRVLALDLE